MKNQIKSKSILCLLLALLAFSAIVPAQNNSFIKRTTYKTETLEFGAGGTLSVTGAPEGSVSIEGWDKNEIEVSAEIEMQAPTEADLAKLAEVSGFLLDQSFSHLRIITIGTHDKEFMKKSAKKFPKNLIGMPLKIDYKIKLPRYADLNITGGSGDFTLSGVDGEMHVKFLNSNAKIVMLGGSLAATFGTGTVDLTIPSRNWRGRFADVQLASGTMQIFLPLNFNAEIDAEVLRVGQIENSFAELKPRARNVKFTEKSISARAGNGGVPLKFTVGDGALKISAVKIQ